MTIRYRDAAGVSRLVASVKLRTGSGLATVDKIRLRVTNDTDPSGLRLIYERGMTLAVNPANATGSTTGYGTIITNSVTVGVAGGAAPYTHSWSIDDTSVAINSASSSTTSFSGYPEVGEPIVATATDTVTDSSGLTSSITVPVRLTRRDPPGGGGGGPYQ